MKTHPPDRAADRPGVFSAAEVTMFPEPKGSNSVNRTGSGIGRFSERPSLGKKFWWSICETDGWSLSVRDISSV